MVKLQCDMREDCQGVVEYVDDSGFIYCQFHGIQRKQHRRCRKLKPKELKSIVEQKAKYEERKDEKNL